MLMLKKHLAHCRVFLINTLFWMGTNSLADAAVINALTDILATWFPVFHTQYVRILFFIIIFSGLAWVNIRGVKQGARFCCCSYPVETNPTCIACDLRFIQRLRIKPCG